MWTSFAIGAASACPTTGNKEIQPSKWYETLGALIYNAISWVIWLGIPIALSLVLWKLFMIWLKIHGV